MNAVIPVVMALIFAIALAGVAGWIGPVLALLAVSASGIVISERRQR